MNLEFKVQEYSRGDGTHHWEAVDCLNGKKIDFYNISLDQEKASPGLIEIKNNQISWLGNVGSSS